MNAIEEMAGMDGLCSDKTGELILNKLTVDKNLIEVQLRAFLNKPKLSPVCTSILLELLSKFKLIK